MKQGKRTMCQNAVNHITTECLVYGNCSITPKCDMSWKTVLAPSTLPWGTTASSITEDEQRLIKEAIHFTPWLNRIQNSQVDGLVQDCSNSSALAMELLQSCTKPSKWLISIWWIDSASTMLYFIKISAEGISWRILPGLTYSVGCFFDQCCLTSIGIIIAEIRQSYDSLIFTMGFPILVRPNLYTQTGCSALWELPALHQ